MRVLIVDYSKQERAALAKSLAADGFDVCFAENPADALEILSRTGDFNAVLLDWRTPISDGLHFLKRLRSVELAGHPEVITLNRVSKIHKVLGQIRRGEHRQGLEPESTSRLIEHVYVALEDEENFYVQRMFGRRSVRTAAHLQNFNAAHSPKL